jgi:tetratricopeptide (TPR) repeat protein
MEASAKTAVIPNPESEITRFWSMPGAAETVLCLTTFLAFVRTLAFGFVYDDQPQIVRNIAVQAWSYLPHYFTSHVWADIYSGRLGNYYRPLFLLWLRLNHAAFGLAPGWWHFTSALCHVLATYLLFRAALQLTRNRSTAFLTGLLFSLHPTHIESVAWISGVTDPLMAVLFLASLLAYLHYLHEGKKVWLAVAVAAFGLALLVKETAIVLPFVLAICLWHREPDGAVAALRMPGRREARSLLWFAVIAAPYLLARRYALGGISPDSAPMSWTSMVLAWPSVIWFYVRHLIWPFGLSEFYPAPAAAQTASWDFAAPLILVLLAAVGLGLLVRCLRLSQATRCALGTLILPLLPALYLPALTAGDVLHDRYLYLPSAGLALLVVLAIQRLANSFGSRVALVYWGLSGILVAGCLFGTVVQQSQWANDRQLYARGLRSAPDNNTVRDNLANTFLATAEYDRALPLYLEVLRRDPNFWRSNYNLAFLYYKTGRYPEAELYFKRAIQIDPSDGDEFLYLAVVEMHQGRLEEAIVAARRAVQLNPKALNYHYVLGAMLKAKGLVSEATEEFRRELASNPGNTAAVQQLAAIEQGK